MKTQLKKLIILAFMIQCLAQPLVSAQENTDHDPRLKRLNEALDQDEKLPFIQAENANAANEPSSAGIVFRTLGAMMLIAGIIFLGAWGVRKMGLGNTGAGNSDGVPQLKILTSVSLGSGRTVSTLLFGERVILIGSTAHSFTLLADEFESDPATVTETPRSVADMLAAENMSFKDELASARINMRGGAKR